MGGIQKTRKVTLADIEPIFETIHPSKVGSPFFGKELFIYKEFDGYKAYYYSNSFTNGQASWLMSQWYIRDFMVQSINSMRLKVIIYFNNNINVDD
jgi:hypothetical protein